MTRPIQHTNPVYSGYFADPFVWQFNDVYYAIGTGEGEAEGSVGARIFPLLQSKDFVHWKAAGTALNRPDPALGGNFWAPEIAFSEGLFYLYYSVGHGDKEHHLRVARSSRPLGPYEDTGHVLLDLRRCPFAIDPHPFRDDDGQWYLFYATDFLDAPAPYRAGTALKAAKLRGMMHLEDPGVTILRARSDWQRFQMNRTMYGAIWDWHTLEGPAVVKHMGRYYCFYSGGRWENDTYGVDYGVAASVLGPYSDSGNEQGPRVLRTVPHEVIGPGHNSVIVGPDGKTDFIVYHAWDKGMKRRCMYINPLQWTAGGPRAAL